MRIAYLGFSFCWGLGLAVLHRFCHLAECEAKLNVALELSGVEPVLLAVCRGVELEESELDRALGKGGVEVQHMVAAVVVVLAPVIVRRSGCCTKCLQAPPSW